MTSQELLDLIARYDTLVYVFLLLFYRRVVFSWTQPKCQLG